MNNEELNALTSVDFYEIKLDSILSNYDYKILTRLYQPLIGYGAMALFMTLWSEFEGDQTYNSSLSTHERLFNNMQCNTYEFKTFRRRLEAVGLLTTKFKQQDEKNYYLYTLKSPLPASDFFRHPLLGILLKQNLSLNDFEKTALFFTRVDKDESNYFDVSATFSEVYKIDEDSSLIDVNDNLLGKVSGAPRVTFDFDTLAIALKDNLISATILTPEVKNEIASLASVYNISLLDMKNIIVQSLQVRNNIKSIDIAKLRENTSNFAKTFLTIPALNQEEVKVQEGSNVGKYSDIVEMFNSLTPAEFLKIKNGGVPPIPQDIALIDELHSKTNLPDPVINVLLDYALITQENKLISSYIMKIAGTLMRSRIQSAVDAMIYFNNIGKSNRKKKDSVYEFKKDESVVKASTPTNSTNTDTNKEGLKAFLNLIKAGDKNEKD